MIKVFISSVQSEFAQERQMLHDYIKTDAVQSAPMYQGKYIEQHGKSIPNMLEAWARASLPEPVFKQEDMFVTTIWRKIASTAEATRQVTGQATGQATEEVTAEVQRVLMVLEGEMKRAEIQAALQLKHDEYFRTDYINPALAAGVIELTFPKSPTHPNQKYRLTPKGKTLKQEIAE